MPINPNTAGIHHINLRSKDLNITKAFYKDVIGLTLALESPEILAFLIGSVFLVFKKATTETGTEVFSPMDIGMDHIALACESEEELNRVAKALTDEGVENTGIKLDATLNKHYVAFKDPDRIQWEFYMS